MRALALVVRGFRNLVDAEFELPSEGVVLVGPNGQGKTNFLEALAYPVLFRSLRGALDREIARFDGPGFHVGVTRSNGSTVTATYSTATRRKKITVDGDEPLITSALGHWLAVAFLPTDLALVQGGASGRRRWLDRMLSLADANYFESLLRYRGVLAQRNAALRQRDERLLSAFDPQLARFGAAIVVGRLAWVAGAQQSLSTELAELGESAPVSLRYRGHQELADPAMWEAALSASRGRDLLRAQTHVGPHRDDVVLGLGGHALRDYGSTGQQRTAAITMRLLELETVTLARGVRPALLVDDVFAALDRDRQQRLATRLSARAGQRIVTAPKVEEIPAQLDLPRWYVRNGQIGPEIR